jgi:gamma-glutamylcyclotransferase (GGCT)/AIG2-like uncharacterized protein YtfP
MIFGDRFGGSMRDLLFVYGSLSEGQTHFKKIESYIDSQQEATALGAVYRLPVGTTAYSVQGMQKISGHVVTLKNPDVVIPLLDQFYGFNVSNPDTSLFYRVSGEAQLSDSGERVQTAVYMINPTKMPRGSQLITDGDWRKALTEKPSLPYVLSDKQRGYIVKLGKLTGRATLPIDLTLYRELMNLELVVDKGRRLALTTLGQDVFRYIAD